ncbi:hypothetical protein ACFPT7_20850 [Acidicapsa dinghuensis]|uniref:Zf-HC2 domain-containing protein n=1 Tax=Acidicapsa dinghuensis TaxID=2218256 RepID=A0ABW1EKL3_9BACT|nr:hypothetical protein [Acidicapsa dinghuensis]
MKHLNEEELVELYYESRDAQADEQGSNLHMNHVLAEKHMQQCEACATAYDGLARVLASAEGEPVPERGAEYGAQVWQAIRSSLPVYEPKRRHIWAMWPRWAYAMAGILLLAGTFYAGKIWERTHTTTVAQNARQGRERVVLFVLDGHLDRSERLLVQLSHAADDPGAKSETVSLPLQSEARQLLADNRLYRQSVAQAKDPLLAGALDHLERVLVEVANSPDDLSTADVEQMEKELNTDGLLFEIRVLRARVADQAKERSGAIDRGRTTL